MKPLVRPVSWKKARSKAETYLPVIQVLEDRLPPGEAFGLTGLALGGVSATLFSALSPELAPVAILPPDSPTDSSRVADVSFGWADPSAPPDRFGGWADSLPGHALETSEARGQTQTPAPSPAEGRPKENPNLLALSTDFLDNLLDDLPDLSNPPRTDVASHPHPLNHEDGTGDAPVRTATLSGAGSHAPVTSDPESGPAGSLGGRGHGLIQPLQPSASNSGPGNDSQLPRLADSGGCSGGSGGSGGCCGTITAQGVNVNAVEAQSVAASGGGLVATFSDSDPNSQASDFSATIMWGDNSSSSGFIGGNSTSGFTVTGDHAYLEEGTFTITVTISDMCNTVTTTSMATVADAPLSWVPNPPTFSWSNGPAHPNPNLQSPGNQFSVENSDVSLQIVGSDPDGDTLTYSAVGLPPGLSISSSGLITGHLDYNAAELGLTGSGDYSVTVAAADGHGGSSAVGFGWFVANTNRPPVLANPGNQTNMERDTPLLTLSASDPDGDPVTFGATNLPPGLTIDANSGVIGGSIDLTGAAGSPYNVTIQASDGTATTSQTFTWTVTNAAPTVDNPGNQTNVQGDAVNLPLVGNDPHGAAITYGATGLPPGLTVNANSGVISGTIAANASNNSPYAVNVSVNNGTLTVNQTFSWVVTVVGVTNPGDQTNNAGTNVNLQIQGRDNNGNNLTYGAQGLPPGLSINTTTGLISGTIAANAYLTSPYTVTVTATKGTASDSQTFAWNVGHAANNPPVVTNPGNQTNSEDDEISLQIRATDADNDKLTYSAAGLPRGLFIHPDTGLIYGFLDDAVIGNSPFNVTVTADDGNGGRDSKNFTWTFNDPNITVNAVAVTVPPEGIAFNVKVATFTATAIPDPYIENLDYGATINWGDGNTTPGTITGGGGTYNITGTHLYRAAGTFNIQVTVVDGGTTKVVNTTATVQEAPLTPNGIVVSNVIGNTNALPIATFTDANPYSNSGEFTVMITDWGDGSGGGYGYVSGQGGQFIVYASHAYYMHGNYTISATILDDGTPLTNFSTTAQIGDIYEGLPANLVVSSFHDDDPNDQPNEYITTINWGDGNSSAGHVDGSFGNFTVSGSHAYATWGQYTVAVTVQDVGGSMVSRSQPVSVADLPLTVYSGNVYAAAGQPTGTTAVAMFTDPDPNAPGGGSATISWGDGSTDSGSVSGSGGLYTVFGNHTYAIDGSYAVALSISPPAAPRLPAVLPARVVALPAPVVVAPKTGSKDVAKGTLKWSITAPNPLSNTVHAEFTYVPADKNPGKTITFIQVHTERTWGGKPVYQEDFAQDPVRFREDIFKYFQRFSTDKAKGNYLDHNFGEDDPYYGAMWNGANWVQEIARWKIGSGPGKANAYITDDPDFPGSRTPGKGDFVDTFEVAAFCIETQQVLGVITWGFKVPEGKKDPIVLLNATAGDVSLTASAAFKGLIAQANTRPEMKHAQIDGKPKITAPNTKKYDVGGTSALP